MFSWLRILIILILVILSIVEILGSVFVIFNTTKNGNEDRFTLALETLNFINPINLPRVIVDQELPDGITNCNVNAIPATVNTDCKTLCGENGQLIYVDENQGYTINGIVLTQGYYCTSSSQDLSNCNSLYSKFVVGTSNEYICEDLFRTGIIKGIEWYKVVNGEYISNIQLKDKITNEIVDPFNTFVNFNDFNILDKVYVDASSATTSDGFNIACKNFTCFKDPCSNLPYTNFRYNSEDGTCTCTGGQNSDKNDPSSLCVGTGQLEDSYDAEKKILTISTNCASSATTSTPFENVYPCVDQTLPITGGSCDIFIVTQIPPFNVDDSLNTIGRNMWNKNVNIPTILFTS